MRIAITAGYGRSLHAIALVHELAAAGHDVRLALQARVLNVARLRYYIRQLGWRKLKDKIRSRLSPASGGHFAAEVAPMRAYFQERCIVSATLAEACRRVGARHVAVAAMNTPKAVNAVRDADIDLVVYAGGGILRRSFIESPRMGVLNAHGGPLPCFRGMNATEWALLHGVRPTVTVHFIDTGIDTGPVFFAKLIPLEPGASIGELRGRGTRAAVESLLEAVTLLAEHALQPTAQVSAAGRQYFVMAEPLLEILRRWLADGRTPTRDADSFSFQSQLEQ